MGGLLPADSDATIVARAPLPPGAVLVLVHNGRDVATGPGEIRRAVTEAHGAYRAEVRVPGAPGTPPIPWVMSNPVYFGTVAADSGTSVPTPPAIAPFPWRIEKDARSSGIVITSDHQVELSYKLADGEPRDQFVALATDVARQPFKTIDLALAGDRPLRVSVQVRRSDGSRWGRSLYVDPAGSNFRIPLTSLRPIGAVPAAVASADVTSIMLVIDLGNAAPGRSGVLRVKASALSN
jgi:hypothetical protein